MRPRWSCSVNLQEPSTILAPILPSHEHVCRTPLQMARVLSKATAWQQGGKQRRTHTSSPARTMSSPSPFHHGEQAVQISAGGLDLRKAVESMGHRVIRSYMPEQHRDFFCSQQLVYFAAQDPATGAVWASVMAGARGFVTSPSNTQLAFAPGSTVAGDPAASFLSPGSYIGMLGLEMHTRRRNRVNGIICENSGPDGSLIMSLSQSFGNCPKYIQARTFELDPVLLQTMSTQAQGPVELGSGLGPAQRRIISNADIFWIATSSATSSATSGTTSSATSAATSSTNSRGSIGDAGSGVGGAGAAAVIASQLLPVAGTATGLDMSHRGGAPGFVALDGDGTMLQWPDYVGNDMFNTLGNLTLNPTAGILFIDWDTGDTLQLLGKAYIRHHDRSLGGERAVEFAVLSWRHAHAALPIRRHTFLEASPYNQPVKRQRHLLDDLFAAAAGAAAAGDDGGDDGDAVFGEGGEWLECMDVRQEAEGIKSYFFEASAAMKAAVAAGQAPYQPGQFASFDFQLPRAAAPTVHGAAGRGAGIGAGAAAGVGAGAAGSSSNAEELVVVNRTWTISSHPAETAATGRFSTTVKRAKYVSRHLYEHMKPGERVLFRGVGGTFTLAGCTKRPVLLIAGGIGITPMRTMFLECIQQQRPATLIYSISSSSEAAFRQELAQAAADANTAAMAAGAAAAPYQVRLCVTRAPPEAAPAAAAAGAVAAAAAALAPSSVQPALPGATPGSAEAAASPPTITGPESRSMWHGRLSAAVLAEAAPDSAQHCVYLCGPEPFMAAVSDICTGELGHAREPVTESFAF